MKKTILFCATITSLNSYSQNKQLKITSLNKQKTSFVQSGNKVLLAVKVPAWFVNQKPADVYRLGPAETADSVFLFTKAKIRAINDSTILLKERNSLFSSSLREIRTSKINAIRKLSAGNQIFRTVTTVGGGLAAGVTLFYSYAATGGCSDCVTGMFKAAGVTTASSRFGRTRIAKKHLDNSLIEVVAIP